MGAILGVLLAVIATTSLIVGNLKFFQEKQKTDITPYLAKKVADQTYTVFIASIKYLSGIGVQPTSWSIDTLKKSEILPSTFSDRTSLGEKYRIYYFRDACNNKVMDVVLKVSDIGDSANKALWNKFGLNNSGLGKRAFYSQVVKELQKYSYDFDMKNPCGSSLPDYYIGYVLNGKLYVNGKETSLAVPSDVLKDDGIFILGYAPNQWGYLVVTFRFLRGDEPKNEYYDWTPSTSFKQLYMSEYLGWRYYNVIWSKTCPDSYVNLGEQSAGYEKSVSASYLNFCIPAFKSDLTLDKVNRIKTEYRKYYGVDASLNPSDGCVIISHIRYFSNDLKKAWGERYWTNCSSSYFSDSVHIDSVFRDVVNRYLYVAHQQAWGGRSRSWLQTYEPLLKYPQPNLWYYHSITIKDPLKEKYYQLVAYFYKFYTGRGCSPKSLGITNTSPLTGYSYPSQATIWSTGDKWATHNTKTVSTPLCYPSLLDGAYDSLGTSQRFTDSKIIVRALDNPADASYYIVPIKWRNGKFGAWKTFYWRIDTPIYH